MPTASATERMVAGSSRSRRVAVSTSSRWWRTSGGEHVDVGRGRSRSGRPRRGRWSRRPREWSPGQPLPMSCSSAATSSRSGRPTRRVSAEARTAVSTRCRSTVQRCTALRCGRQRTRSQSGSSRVISPSASSASQTGDGRLARAEQGDELLARLGGPGHRQRPASAAASRRTAGSGERQPGLGRPRRRRAAAAPGRGRGGRCGRARPRRPARRRPRRAACALRLRRAPAAAPPSSAAQPGPRGRGPAAPGSTSRQVTSAA